MTHEQKQLLLDYQKSQVTASITKFLQQVKAIHLFSTDDVYAEIEQQFADVKRHFSKLRRSTSDKSVLRVRRRKDNTQSKS